MQITWLYIIKCTLLVGLMGSLSAGLVWFLVRRIMPHLKGYFGRNDLKFTLGFYFLTFFFVYLAIPLVKELSEAQITLYREGLAIVGTSIGAITFHYFNKNGNGNGHH